jgi:hypothetical protein
VQPNAPGRLAAAGRALLDEHPVEDLADPCEPLRGFKAAVPFQAADGLALVINESQEGSKSLNSFLVTVGNAPLGEHSLH